jgi:hypothetical protein
MRGWDVGQPSHTESEFNIAEPKCCRTRDRLCARSGLWADLCCLYCDHCPGIYQCSDMALDCLTLYFATRPRVFSPWSKQNGGCCIIVLESVALCRIISPGQSLVLLVNQVPIVVDRKQVQRRSHGHAPLVFHFRRGRLSQQARTREAHAKIIFCRLGKSRKSKMHQVPDICQTTNC